MTFAKKTHLGRGRVSIDFYHRYQSNIALMANCGLQAYPTQRRIPKDSFTFYRDLIRTRRLPKATKTYP